MEQEKKISFRCSPFWAGLAVLLLGGLIAGFFYFTRTVEANARTIQQLEGKNRKTQSEVIALNGSYSVGRLEEVRASTDKVRESMISGEEADGILKGFHPRWSVTSRTDDPNSEFVQRHYTLVRGIAPVREWEDVLAVLQKISGIPNLALSSLSIETFGDSRQRDFSQVSASLTIYIRKPETP